MVETITQTWHYLANVDYRNHRFYTISHWIDSTIFRIGKEKGRVIGINFVFLTMDSLGAIFSLLSIVVGKFDILSCILYAVVIALELGIFTSHLIWWLGFGKDAPKESELLKWKHKQKNAPLWTTRNQNQIQR